MGLGAIIKGVAGTVMGGFGSNPLGWLSSAFNLYNSFSAGADADASRANQQQAYQQQLERENARLARIEAVTGPLLKNIGGFYNSLTPDSLIRTSIANLELFMEKRVQDYREEMAKRGFSPGSGQEEGYISNLRFKEAVQKAEIYSTAKKRVAEAQIQGYQSLMPRQQGIEQQQAQTSALGQQLYAQDARFQTQRRDQYRQDAWNFPIEMAMQREEEKTFNQYYRGTTPPSQPFRTPVHNSLLPQQRTSNYDPHGYRRPPLYRSNNKKKGR